jgi:hypothetical protein
MGVTCPGDKSGRDHVERRVERRGKERQARRQRPQELLVFRGCQAVAPREIEDLLVCDLPLLQVFFLSRGISCDAAMTAIARHACNGFI